MKRWQAGVTNISYPYSIRWTSEFVLADSAEAAEELFGERGFYRNLVVRDVSNSPKLNELSGMEGSK